MIRAAGGGSIGAGHLIRCLSLAQACRAQGGRAAFAIDPASQALADRLAQDANDVYVLNQGDAAELIRLAHQWDANLVLLDGYNFDEAYHQAIASQFRLITIDDYGHNARQHAHWLLNPNLGADESLYQNRPSHCHLFLGSRYTLFRRDFLEARQNHFDRPIKNRVERVLVTLGGSDSDNHTFKVVQALKKSQIDVQVDIILGAWHPDPASIQTLIADQPRWRILQNVANMADLLSQADLAILGGGTTLWESCLLGTPALVMIIAENQRPGAEMAFSAELAVRASEDPAVLANQIQELDRQQELRAQLSQAGREQFDGRGAARVLALLDAPLRPVLPSDSQLVFQWSNDRETRQNAFSTQTISWSGHLIWFERKLHSLRSWFYIGFNSEHQPIGYIRFDLDRNLDNQPVTSIAIAPTERGKGFGSRLIAAGVDLMRSVEGFHQVHAYIKPDNTASLRSFEKAGFRQLSSQPESLDVGLAFHLVRG